MRYTLKHHSGKKYFVDNKQELFSIFDSFQSNWGKWSGCVVTSYFTDNFIFSNSGRFVVKEEYFEKCHHFYEGEYTIVYKATYVNALYIIYNDSGQKINLEELKEQYVQSRKLEKKKNKNLYHYDRSTASYRNKWKCSRYKDRSRHNSYTKEYRDNIYAFEENIKIRKKRATQVEKYHVFYYDYEYYRDATKSWKYKKVKKQWGKHNKKAS